MPKQGQYETQFEKELYMTINLTRVNPKTMVSEVERVARFHPVCKNLDSMELLDVLSTGNLNLNGVKSNEHALAAVRKNNKRLQQLNEQDPQTGGNVAEIELLIPLS